MSNAIAIAIFVSIAAFGSSYVAANPISDLMDAAVQAANMQAEGEARWVRKERDRANAALRLHQEKEQLEESEAEQK